MSESAIESFEIGAASVVASADLLAKFLARLAPSWPRDRALRILQIGHGPLSSHAAALAGAHGACLTIFDPNQRRLEHARLAFARDGRSHLRQPRKCSESAFDLIIAADGLHRIASSKVLFAQLIETMGSEALIAASSRRLPYSGILFSVCATAGSTAKSRPKARSFHFPLGQLSAPPRACKSSSLRPSRPRPARLFSSLGRRPNTRRRSPPAKAFIISDRDPQTSETAAALRTSLKPMNGLLHRGWRPVRRDLRRAGRRDRLPRGRLAGFEKLGPVSRRAMPSAQTLRRKPGRHKARFWIVSPGAVRSAANSASPIESGFWAFTRHSPTSFRRMTCAGSMSLRFAAAYQGWTSGRGHSFRDDGDGDRSQRTFHARRALTCA